MAGIIPTPGAPVGGSYGSLTVGRNRYGTYQRNRTKPVNPNSAFQQAARQAFRQAVDEWTNTLTALERAGWETYAAATPWLNKAGETVHLTGQAEYIRVRTFLIRGNVATISAATAPTIFDRGSIALTTISFDDTGAFGATAALVNNPWNVTGGILSLQVSAPANPSINFRPNRFQALAPLSAVGMTPTPTIVVSSNPGVQPTFTYAAPQKVWFKARGMTPDLRLTVDQLYGPITVTA